MRILIDDTFYDVSAGKNLLEACIGLGLDLPYFCYHPAMGSIGACRQCAVKKYANSEDKKGRIVMACMEPVTDGMIISILDPEVRQFRASVIEGLMNNHPHDCPVCDEGGECHLQDMTVMTGHNYRRFSFKKRTFISQDLGPFIHHEMNRCIQCYRCVRFYRDYAGGRDLNVFGSANQLYFGRKQDGVLENEFSGNLVEVCPTGVFTDKTLKQHYARKWDLTSTPSVCVHCSIGCNTFVGERYGSVRRIMNRYHGEINGYFLCDRGRFGYEFLHHPSRIKNIIVRYPEISYPGSANLNTLLPGIADSHKNGRIIGIGSPRASVESNFALMTLVGKDRFFSGIPRHEHKLIRRALDLLNSSTVHAASLKDIEECDAAFIFCQDVSQTAPVMALSLRQMTRNKGLKLAEKAGIPRWNDAAARELAQHEKSPLYIAHSFSTQLDDVAAGIYHAAPPDLVRLGYAVAAAIDNTAPAVTDSGDEMKNLAARIAADLLSAERPLIVTGILGSDHAVLDAVNNLIVALALKNRNPSLAVAFPESNSAGLASMDTATLDDALDLMTNKPADVLIILENDLYRRLSKENADKLVEKCRQVVVIDHMLHATARKAHLVLPAATWTESSGTIVNHEGRAQRYYPVMPVSDPVRESWQWIIDLLHTAGIDHETSWTGFDDVVNSLTHYFPAFAAIKNQLPNSVFRFHNEKIARQTLRFSGRTAITAEISVSEPGPPQDLNSPLNFSMEGYKGRPPASLIPYYWFPGWNSPQAVNKYLDKPNGSVEDGDPGVSIFANETTALNQYAKNNTSQFKAADGELYLLPVYLVFGSEELSAHGQAVSKRIPSPFVLMNEKDMERWKVNASDFFNLAVGGSNIKVQIRTDKAIPEGVAGLTVLLPGMDHLDLPAPAKITRDSEKLPRT